MFGRNGRSNGAYGIIWGLIFWSVPFFSYAIFLSQSAYILPGPILFNHANCSTPNVNAIVLYDITLGTTEGGFTCRPDQDGDLIEIYGSEIFIDNHEYSIIEVSVDGICDADTYAECKARPEFVNEFLFKVTPPPATTLYPKSIIAHRPEVTINFPKDGNFVAGMTTIKYLAEDQDNFLYPPYGFGDSPIDIYYSDDKENWIRVAEKTKNTGEYIWDAAALSEGEYWLKIRARDEGGESDEEISGPWGIDTITPSFEVVADPAVSKGEPVKIMVSASEPLMQSPEVVVRQKGYADISVFMHSADLTIWEGEYEVRSGADGTARISVNGKDLAGNTGSRITRGGFFSVGILPPPTPVIIYPHDGDIATSTVISLNGTIREDTKARVFLNDDEFALLTPDENGNFAAQDIALSPSFNNGVNILKIFAEDEAGNLSDPAILNIKFNLVPQIFIKNPGAGATTSATTTIEISASDENRDKLVFDIEVSSDEGTTFQEIASGIARPAYLWDTREFPDGKYILRVAADDGTAKVFATSSEFFVQNFLPVISFPQKKLYSRESDIKILGTAATPTTRNAPRQIISLVESSIDQGKTWQEARSIDGVFDEPEEDFSISLQNLSEGKYEILVRSRDIRRLRGKTRLELTVDRSAPVIPEILTPGTASILGDAADIDTSSPGVQAEIRGRAEPENKVEISADGEKFEGVSDSGGNFSVKVSLRKHGDNIFKVTGEDRAGNRSGESGTLVIKYNNPPEVRFLRPKDGGGLNHTAEVLAEVQDRDLDPIAEISLWYRRPGEDMKRLIKKIPAPSSENSVFKFAWDVSGLAEGRYELIAEASDGVSVNSLTREVLVDNTPPEILAEPLSKNVFTGSFTLEMRGEARDGFSGIEYVEYKIDRAEDASSGPAKAGEDMGKWFKAVIMSGWRERSARFRMRHPVLLPDGEYGIKFRSSDTAGNVSGESPSQKITVDTTPPRVGSFSVTRGPIALLPEGGSFLVPPGAEFSFAISLEKDTTQVSLIIGAEETRLTREGGIWRGKFKVGGDENSILFYVSAEDALGNKTGPKQLGAFSAMKKGGVSSGGRALSGAYLSVFEMSGEDGSRVLWDGASFGEKNPVLTDASGNYELLLPVGRYEILLQREGYRRVRTSAFTLTRPAFIHEDMVMEERKGLRGFLEDKFEAWGY